MTTDRDGLFFEKRSQASAGRFFRDLPGREDGEFMAKGASESPAPKTEKVDVGVTGGPVGGAGEKGEGVSGGIYGCGKGTAKAAAESKMTKEREADHARLKELLANAAGGTERKAAIEKTSSRSPSDWDADASLPTGFHREAVVPAEGQDGVEPGGERFHSTDVKEAQFGATDGVRHGLTETGGMKTKGAIGSQQGKHASVGRFLGTPHGVSKTATSYGEQQAGQMGGSLGQFGENIKAKGKEVVEGITSSPNRSAAAAAVAGLLGLRGLKGLGRGGARILRGKKKSAPGLIGQGVGALSKLVRGK